MSSSQQTGGIAVVSLTGGTGRTTVTANLAATLASGAHRCTAVDVDPQNALGTHFGMSPAEEAGLVNRSGLYRPPATSSRVSYVPFGPGRDVARAEREARNDPRWLRSRLQSALDSTTDLMLFDTPATRGVWLEQALEASDTVIVVLRPDAASYATLPALADLFATFSGKRVAYVVNQMDSRSELSRQVQQALSNSLGRSLLPITIPTDEAVREAHARQRTITVDSPGSQVTVRVRHLAEWVTEGTLLEAGFDAPRMP